MKHLLFMLAFAASESFAQHAGHAHHDHHAARPAHSGVFSIDAVADGHVVHRLTGNADGEAASLWYSRSPDGGTSWSVPVRVDTGQPAPRITMRGDNARIALVDGRLVAVWTVPGTGWGGSGPFEAAVSTTGGRTWVKTPGPSDTGLTTAHGYLALLPTPGALHAVWLDSRDQKQGLRYARSVDGGRSWEKSVTVTPGTCECCWNSMAQGRDGTVHVLYRGKEPRDMRLASREPLADWRLASMPVGAFDWRIQACPETGGALVAGSAARDLHALVWTGAEHALGLHYVRSTDGGGSWTKFVRIGSQGAQHADLARAQDDTLVAAWDETTGNRSSIWLAASLDAGRTWNRPRQLSADGADATHPRVIATADGILVLWNERSEAGKQVLQSRPLTLEKLRAGP